MAAGWRAGEALRLPVAVLISVLLATTSARSRLYAVLLLIAICCFSVQVDPKVAFPRQSNPVSSQPKVDFSPVIFTVVTTC